MKNKHISIAIVASAIATMLGVPAALADQRLTISSSSGAVLNGTTSTFTVNSNTYDFPSSEWANFKFEVISAYTTGSTATLVAQQLSSSVCQGVTGSVVNSLRPCTVSIGSGRSVIQAGASYESSLYLNTLKLTPNSGPANLFQVRGWLDRNSNNLIDPFEPLSPTSKLQSINPATAKSFINFQVEPPLVQNTNVKAWVSAGTGAAVVGGTTNVGGLIDPSLLTVQIQNCTAIPCTTISTSGTWNPSNLQKQFEYTSTQSFSHGAKLKFNLFYNPYADSTLKSAVKLASRTFDYSESLPYSIKTEILSNGVTSAAGIQSGNHKLDSQRQNFAEYNVKSFIYRAKVLGANQQPLKNKPVYLNVDLYGMSSWSGIKADGVPLSNVVTDRTMLTRHTDSQGLVEVQFQVPDQASGSQLEIDAIISGLRASEIVGDGKEEVLVWKSDLNRHLSLSFHKYSSSDGSGLTLNALVRNSEGDLVSGERVIFSSGGPFTFSDVMPVLNSLGKASTTVRLAPDAPRSGKAEIVAQTVSFGDISEKKTFVIWDEYGLYMEGSSVLSGSQVVNVIYLGDKKSSSDGTISAKLKLNTYSAGAAKLEPARVSLSGPGKLLSVDSQTDKLGFLNFKIGFKPQELGVAKLTVFIPNSGVIKHFRVLNGVTAEIKSTGSKALVTVSHAKGSVITVYVNNVISYTKTATSDDFSFSTVKVESGQKPIKVFVDGVKVVEKTINFPKFLNLVVQN